VLLGLRRLKEGRISVIAAGINPGANLGVDFYLSGTCGAALMGAFRKVTSIAFSLDVQQRPDGSLPEPEWPTAVATARTICRAIEAGDLPDEAFLNVNIPALPLDKLRGISITNVAPGGYVHLSEKGDGVHERLERQLIADTRHAHPGTDIRAVIDGYVSISPLATTLTRADHFEALQERIETIGAALR
jgi:5'-nucleotidase